MSRLLRFALYSPTIMPAWTKDELQAKIRAGQEHEVLVR
jgi:hypothetical protein